MDWQVFGNMLHARSTKGYIMRISSDGNDLLVLAFLTENGWKQIQHINIKETELSYDKSIDYLREYAIFLNKLSER